MNLKDDPAYAWLYRPASQMAMSPDLFTEQTGTFIDRVRKNPNEFLEDERAYARKVLSGKLKFHTDNIGLAKWRATEMLTHISVAHKALDAALAHAKKDEKSPAINNELSKFAAQLVHLHYLRRELEILRIFIPLATAKMLSQRHIQNMTIEATQAAEAMHNQWREWASSLVKKQPELEGNKSAIAGELKRLYSIEHAVDTIRKKI